jgi:general secretion pathway protein F
MARHSRAFPDVFIASVRAGELSGDLPVVLKRMARFLDWTRAIRAMTVQALVYPFLLLLAISGLIVVLLTWLLPRILGLFPGGRTDLPVQTQVVIAISDFLIANSVLLGTLVVGIGVSAVVLRKNARARVLWGRFLLAIPRLGKVARMLSTSKFAFTALTLHKAGCDVFETLRVAGRTCGNEHLGACFARAADRVRAGSTITEGLSREESMDPLLLQVTAVGEHSGKLDEALESLVEYYDQEVPRAVKWFLSLFEPALLLTAGAVVAFILMAALLPIFSLYENIA